MKVLLHNRGGGRMTGNMKKAPKSTVRRSAPLQLAS